MKKFITFIVAAFCLASSMSAQGSYYYYHGAKMPLSEDATKIVSIAPRTENITLSPSNELVMEKRCRCHFLFMVV